MGFGLVQEGKAKFGPENLHLLAPHGGLERKFAEQPYWHYMPLNRDGEKELPVKKVGLAGFSDFSALAISLAGLEHGSSPARALVPFLWLNHSLWRK